jgi:cell division protein FtsI (penicillin-binding protein 3)
VKRLSSSPNASRYISGVGSDPGVVTPMRRLRVFIVLALLAAWAGTICVRLVWLQVFKHHYYVEEAARQQEHSFEVAPRRGILYDRNLHALAMTVLVDSIYAVPSEIHNKRAVADELAKIVHTDPLDSYTTGHRIWRRLEASRDFAWVARKQSKTVVEQVKALKLKGIYFQKEFKRFYPDNKMLAQVLGYVGIDDNGLGGLEAEYNKELRGEPGRMLTAVDARRHVLGSTERDPMPGENLVLTIDQNIQFMAERALEENMERTHALHGTIIVQDPHTGQILAIAMRPTFNPNDYRHTEASLLRDRAVSDVYEPGSVFKVVTYSAALQEHVVTPDSMIPTLGGHINVAGRIVHDDNDAIRYEAARGNVLTATQALEQSSDVAAIELAERLGKDRFYRYIRAFGFGQPTGIELPGETRGLLKPPKRWNPTTIGSIPMGQEIGVTPLQVVSMASTVANGGVYLPPHILMQNTQDESDGHLVPVAFRPGHDVPDPLPEGAHRVISTMTAAVMRKMMEDVVEHGTGIPAQLNGYSAAGKTGTAEKIDPRTHTYSKTNYIASFVGFAPVSNPAITIVVVMDSPSYKYHYGTAASAPVFRELAQQILEYLGVPHDEPLKTTQEMAAIEKTSVEQDDGPEQHLDDLSSLFDEVNHLPADDPLRQQVDAAGLLPVSEAAEKAEQSGAAQRTEATAVASPEKVGSQTQPVSQQMAKSAPPGLPVTPAFTPAQVPAGSGLVVHSAKRVAVPSFLGEPVRAVIEKAGSAGLGVQLVGSGIARQQVPAAGTMVPAGTSVVVQFNR